jgi:tetratricopeptide (TPR) repeat protein
MLAMGRLDDALADYDRAIELWPGFPAALAKRAEVLRLRARAPGGTPASIERDLAASEAAARAAIASCPRLGLGYRELALTRAVRGDQAGRLEALRRGVEALPNNANTQLGYALAVCEQVEAQVPEMVELMKADPPEYAARAEGLRVQLKEAEGWVLKAIGLSPFRVDAYELLSKLRVLLQDPAGELQALKLGVEKMPLNARMWYTLGELYKRRKRWEEAAESYYQATKYSTESVLYLRRHAEALLEQGKLEDAESSLRRATRIAPTQYLPWYELGKVLLEQERFEEAKLPLARAQKLTEKRKEEIAFFLGGAFWGAGNELQAARHYEHYLTKGKAPSRVRLARERLAEAKRIRARRGKGRGG